MREAIVACTDPALEASASPPRPRRYFACWNIASGVTHTANVQSLGNIADTASTKTQSSEAHQWTLYLLNGATYERGQWRAFKRQAKHHVRFTRSKKRCFFCDDVYFLLS